MATSIASFLFFSLSVLLLCNISLAQLGFGQGQGQSPWQSQRRQGQRNECRLDRLSALEPSRRVESEAGVTEYFYEHDDQLRCAGVSVRRRTIEPRGLLLPSYSNSPRLVYIVRGRGITSTIFPGCPETFQQSSRRAEQQREEGQSQRLREEHQRVRRFREGDIIAMPAGVAHWCYNDGDTPVVAITIFDTRNNANQLDARRRDFRLSGGQRRGQQHEESSDQEENILRGFDEELLAEAMGVNRELVRKLQRMDSRRGEIVQVEEGLRLLRPSRTEEEREEREEEEEESRRRNGLEEAFCNMRQRMNIGDPARADVYSPRGGRITMVNAQKLPILNLVQMSAERGVLYRNAFLAPHWNINAHSVVYVTGGRCRCQIADHRGRNVFDGELRRGQLLVIPQNFAVLAQAQSEGFEWVSFRTNSRAMVNPIVGKTSALRGMPEDVLANSFNISRDEARRLKFNRGDETAILTPRFEAIRTVA